MTAGCPTSADHWPPWFAPVGFLAAFAIATILGGAAVVIIDGGTTGDSSPGAAIAATMVQDASFLVVAWWLARRVGIPSIRDFGLRRASLGRVAMLVVLGGVAYALFSTTYDALVGIDAEQDTLDVLGVERSTLLLVLGAVLVVGIAPIAEEVFFRGFMYRSLRNRLGPFASCAVMGAIFGSVHYSGPDTLKLLPVLAVLGVIFCVLYEWSGTLYAPIALHGANNALAFAVAGGPGAGIAGPLVGAAVVLGCITACRPSPRRGPWPDPPAQAPAAG